MTWIRVLLVLLISSAGCDGSVAAPPIDPNGGTPGEPPEWSTPVRLFDSDGRIAAGRRLHAVGRTGGTVVHRSSSDEGATWSNPVPIPGAGGALPLYGPLAVGDSIVHLVSRSGGSLRAQRSTDFGQTWSEPRTLSGYSADDRDRVQVDTDGAYVHVFVGRAGAVPDASHRIHYWRSSDRGATWSDGTVVHVGAEAPSPGGIAAAGGTVHIAYAAMLPNVGTLGHRARYIRSSNNGQTWSEPADVGGGSSNPQIRPRPRTIGGRVIVMWEEPLDHDPGGSYPNATRSQVRASRSVNDGGAWQAPADITAVPNRYVNHPEIAVGPGALVHIAYRISSDQATTARSDPIGYRLSRDFGATWGDHEIAIDVPGAETHLYNLVSTASFVHMMVGGSGFHHARRPLPEAQ